MKLSPRFTKALVLATELHQDQLRKGAPIPYISHLLGVASLVLEYGGDEDEAIAALLHDAIEDQGGAKTRELIRLEFGDRVTAIVDGCTDSDTKPRPPWQERKERYIEHLKIAEPSVLLVATADKICNARSILKDYALMGEEVWQKFQGKKHRTIWYYQTIVEVLNNRRVEPPLTRELIKQLTAIISIMTNLVSETSGEVDHSNPQ